MSPLEQKKTKLELSRVSLAKEEMEMRIAERMDEIARLQDQIKIQDEKINELTMKLAEANN